ncbi:LysR family transcriptional regulator [Trabulsiella odontotermitis]|uniref:LysR family transcriptional regulator n=1 Tax=Trabulsiella odontotermitis TaxID=379893 RepID=UPI0006BA62CF|nr:LysR family transcriptional regulator [Trabulsiella odontotermitis]
MGYLLSKKMRYFMVTMELRNFAKAAEALCITRSPLSKVICELEDYLGGILFKRKYNELEPTELAWEYYNKFRSVYTQLMDLENEIQNKEMAKELTILFDVTFPELVFKHIVMVIESSGLKARCERGVVDPADINNLRYNANCIIFSLRDISLSYSVQRDEWFSGNLVLLAPKDRDPESAMKLFVWKDANVHYSKEIFKNLLADKFSNIEFIEHNWEFLSMLYNIHSGKGCCIMTEKFATLFRVDGVDIIPLKNVNLKIRAYHCLKPEYANEKEKVKGILNAFI